MDNKPLDQPMTSRKGWPVVLWLSKLLDHAEREAVLGDLTENGDSSGRAIANVVGIVVRRQTEVFFSLRLWVVVTFVVLPTSYLLSAIADGTAGEGAVYSWMYLNNWDWALTKNPGFWLVLRETATNFGITCLVLACCSWSAGFLIGRFAKTTLRASRKTFIVLLVALFSFDAPARVIQLWWSLHHLPLAASLPDTHAPITANVFYHVFFPWIVLAILVVVPAFSGIRQGNRSLIQGRKIQAVLPAAAIISVLIMLMNTPGFGLAVGATVREWLWRNRNAMQMLLLLCCWPVFYLTAIAVGRRRRRKTAFAQ